MNSPTATVHFSESFEGNVTVEVTFDPPVNDKENHPSHTMAMMSVELITQWIQKMKEKQGETDE